MTTQAGEPLYLLQIYDIGDDCVVKRIAGGGPLEVDFVKTCTEHIVQKGVGLFRTEAVVARAIKNGITEAIMNLKRQV